jgi:hypothetical protein
MARVVLGLGTSHTPLLVLEAARWVERAEDDYVSDRLITSDGRSVNYATLKAERGEPYVADATIGNFVEQFDAAQRALDRLADEIEAASPDVVLIVGDDQDELFDKDNTPAFAIYYGQDVVMHPWQIASDTPNWRLPVTVGYKMDAAHVFPGHPALGEWLIRGLIARDVDVGSARIVRDPETRGFGHAYGFIVDRLFRGRSIPMVPLLLNTYFPPSTPRPGRCYDIGRKIAEAIAEFPEDLKVCVIASGGLSHFVTDAELDLGMLGALFADNRDALAEIPEAALLSGSSEIRNWIMVGGIVSGMKPVWRQYIPVYRTPSGTGIGLGFAAWHPIFDHSERTQEP